MAPTGTLRAGAWLDDGRIVFSTTDQGSGLWSVGENGGSFVVLTTPDRSGGEVDHLFPAALPGSRGVLFTIVGQSGPSAAVFDLQKNVAKVLVPGAACARYAGQGWLVYAKTGALYAAPFNLAALTVTGDAVTLTDRVLMGTAGWAYFATSDTGAVAFAPPDAGDGPPRSLVWVDRRGAEIPVPAPTRAYSGVRLSPDGTQLAVSIAADEHDIWTVDVTREALSRTSTDSARDSSPVWTPDGRHLIFTSTRGGTERRLYRQAADGSGAAERIAPAGFDRIPTSVTADGAYVLGNQTQRGAWDLFRASLDPSGRVESLFESPTSENYPALSPNNRYVACRSDESRTEQVFVRPYPRGGDARWQVSTEGGTFPKWSSASATNGTTDRASIPLGRYTLSGSTVRRDPERARVSRVVLAAAPVGDTALIRRCRSRDGFASTAT